MIHNVRELKTRLSGKVGGGTLSGSKAYNGIIEASINMKSKITLEGSRKEAKLTNPFFDSIHDYLLPVDFEELINIRSKETGKSFVMRYEDQKTVNDRGEPFYNIRMRNGQKILNFNYTGSSKQIEIFKLDSLEGVGTVGSIRNLSLEKVKTTTGSAVRFDLPATSISGGVYLQKEDIDISAVGQAGSIFADIYIESVNDTKIIDNFTLEISDGVNIQSIKTSITQSSDQFEEGFNKVRFQLDENQNTLSLETIDYIQILVKYNSAGDTLTSDIKNIIIDNVVAHKGEEVYIDYYGNYIFNNKELGFKPRPRDDDDLIYLTDTEFNILVYETIIVLALEIQGSSSAKAILEAEKNLYGGIRNGRNTVGLYENHKTGTPNEQKSKSATGYNVPKVVKRIRRR